MSEQTQILVLNAGSSSLKFSLIAQPSGEILMEGLAEKLNLEGAQIRFSIPEKKTISLPPKANHKTALDQLVGFFSTCQIDGVGHRVVHGGEAFHAPTLINADRVKTLKELIPLAPLHNPPNIEGIEAAQAIWPNLPQIAVFDTAFHQTLPEHAYLYALPYELYQSQGVRKYGFHGSSHQYVSQKLRQEIGAEKTQRMITAHLGNGCSLSAILDGQSVDTSMGMTPLEGLVMGTRSGDLDPGLLLFLARELKMPIDEMDTLLNKKSGLLGVSGISSDYRELEQAHKNGHRRASLALSIFAYRAAKAIASFTVPLNGLDALVFTGGIGENGHWIRAKIVERLGHLGLALDAQANQAQAGEKPLQISASQAPTAWVIPTWEEGFIAAASYQLIKENIQK